MFIVVDRSVNYCLFFGRIAFSAVLASHFELSTSKLVETYSLSGHEVNRVRMG